MIYLREKRSGNFEITNKKNATVKFKTQKSFKKWYREGDKDSCGCRYGAKIIKATYRKSQTYFSSPEELIMFIKNN